MLTPASCDHNYRSVPAAVHDANGVRRTTNSALRLDGLSPQQRRIVELIAHGRTDKQIARELNIGVGTAKTHCRMALARLGLARRCEIAAIMPSGAPGKPAESVHLSPRLLEVLEALSAAGTYRQIAERIGCCRNTVGVHASSIYRAIGVTNRSEAAIWWRNNSRLIKREA